MTLSLNPRFGADIDHADRDSRRSTVARYVAAAGSAGFLWINISLATAIVWATLNVLSEIYHWLAGAHGTADDGGAVSPVRRTHFVIASALMTLNWSASATLYWFSHRDGLPLVGVLVLTGQLIHAQAFAFRSNAILAVTAGIPAVALIVLPLAFGGLQGGALAAEAFAIALTLTYVAASAQANITAAEALRVAYDEVRQLAYFDTLTGLSNRRMFNEDFEKLVMLANRCDIPFALVLLDLDGLKVVNDRHGHAAGDAVLVEISARLKTLVGSRGSIARIGGDEFAILLSGVGRLNDIDAFCATVVETLGPSVTFQGHRLVHTPSMGVAVFPHHGRDQDGVYKAADLALYAAKNGGRNTWRLCGDPMPA